MRNLRNQLDTILFYAAKDRESLDDVLLYLKSEGEHDPDFAKMHKMLLKDTGKANRTPKRSDLAQTHRSGLAEYNGQRKRFSATVKRFGKKRAFKGPDLDTILLTNLCFEGTNVILADHLWMTCGKWSNSLCIGDVFTFDARVGTYEKGYHGYREDIYKDAGVDFRLERPTKIMHIKR